MAANPQNPNRAYPGNQLQVNPQAAFHGKSKSQPHAHLNKYQSSPALFAHNPISHFSNQYAAHASVSKKIYIPPPNQSKPEAIRTPSAKDKDASSTKGDHARTSSLSYIQQRQQQFFSDSPIEPASESDDDDVYEEMYKDGLGVKHPTKGAKKSKSKHKKKKKQHANKAREETEDVWCCSICTYQNNMLLAYCELCGCKKSVKPSIVKRPVYTEENVAPPDIEGEEMSPTPEFLSDSVDINKDAIAAQEEEHTKVQEAAPVLEAPHQQIPDLVNIEDENKKAKQKQIHRYSQSAANVFLSQQNKLQYWRCAICTFAENPNSRPVCKMCSALPPEQPPSPNVEAVDDKKAAAVIKEEEEEEINEADLDPLGHQKSTSITHLQIMDESKVVINKKEDNNILSLSGGKSYAAASQSGQNIIRGLQANDRVPDLPPEESNINNKANNNKSGGIFGWFNRKRAQSEDLKQDKNGLKDRLNSKRNISVATMPKKQQEKIAKRLGGLCTKKDLLRELDSSSAKLTKKLKQHAAKVMELKSKIVDYQKKREMDLQQWNSWYILELVDLCYEYYNSAISQLNDEIQLEKLHIECFTEKLQRLENASLAIRRNGKKWNVDDIRNNIEVAFHTAWRIRLSQDVPEKQDYCKQLGAICAGLLANYELRKSILGIAEISAKDRAESIFLFLQSTLAKYESYQMAENRQFKLSANLQNECDFYCPYCENDQNVFDSFILDQRTKEGRIVHRWLVFVAKKHREITFNDLADFMQKLAHTFLHSYCLQTKQYYECVRILCYRCILRRSIIKKLIYHLLNVSASRTQIVNYAQMETMQQIAILDVQYQKKVMWMRALNEKQLGIFDDYWLRKEINDYPSSSSSAKERRSSQIALLAGRDIPFAQSINLMGELQVDEAILARYKKQLKNNQNSKNNQNKKKRSFLKKKKKEEESKKEQDDDDDDEIIPFVLPQEALQSLLAATKSIYKTAMKYYYFHYPQKENDVNDDGAYISQDDLFPIILYCVIQSKLETPHKLIHFIEHILPQEKTTMGQSAFALSALKAAVEYISQANPTTFGMDAEIELD